MADYIESAEVSTYGHEFAALVDNSALLSAASRLFDKLTEVDDDFYRKAPDEEPIVYTTRDFYGDGTAYLKVDPFTALDPVDPITINEGTIALPSYSTTSVPEYVNRDGTLIVL